MARQNFIQVFKSPENNEGPRGAWNTQSLPLIALTTPIITSRAGLRATDVCSTRTRRLFPGTPVRRSRSRGERAARPRPAGTRTAPCARSGS